MERCWLCNRNMKLKHDKDGYWLWCGKCAAVYMEGKLKKTKEEFLADYARFYRRKRDGNQLSLDLDCELALR